MVSRRGVLIEIKKTIKGAGLLTGCALGGMGGWYIGRSQGQQKLNQELNERREENTYDNTVQELNPEFELAAGQDRPFEFSTDQSDETRKLSYEFHSDLPIDVVVLNEGAVENFREGESTFVQKYDSDFGTTFATGQTTFGPFGVAILVDYTERLTQPAGSATRVEGTLTIKE